MRNALYRAVLRRLLLRSSVIVAFGLALLAFAAPTAWFGHVDPTLARVSCAALATVLLAIPGAAMTTGRRARTRVTAPRPAL